NGTLENGTYKVIASFDQQQTIAEGTSQTYRLEATPVGLTANSIDKITTRLATGDEFVPLTGLEAATNPNTGKVYVAGDAAAGIFSVAATDFSQLASTARNFIWSDGSAASHAYPTVADGVVNSDSGTADFTN